MGLDIRDTGKKTSNMVKALKHGLTVLAIRETMWKARSMDKESLPGLMEALIKASSTKTTLKEKV